ncbi:hypothetical protein CHCC20335_4161 [Bacillus paralicheniformis]|nr:hypothetical protein CHCC20335_4161 [Bacillus paralicheniformis]
MFLSSIRIIPDNGPHSQIFAAGLTKDDFSFMYHTPFQRGKSDMTPA